MKRVLSLLAQGASVDRFSNRLSVFNVIESIEAPSFPLLFPEAIFVSILRKETGDLQASDATLSVHQGDSTVGQANIRVDFENGQHARQIINFQGLPLLKPINLEFRLSLATGAVFVLEIPVTQTTPAGAMQGS